MNNPLDGIFSSSPHCFPLLSMSTWKLNPVSGAMALSQLTMSPLSFFAILRQLAHATHTGTINALSWINPKWPFPW